MSPNSSEGIFPQLLLAPRLAEYKLVYFFCVGMKKKYARSVTGCPLNPESCARSINEGKGGRKGRTRECSIKAEAETQSKASTSCTPACQEQAAESTTNDRVRVDRGRPEHDRVKFTPAIRCRPNLPMNVNLQVYASQCRYAALRSGIVIVSVTDASGRRSDRVRRRVASRRHSGGTHQQVPRSESCGDTSGRRTAQRPPRTAHLLFFLSLRNALDPVAVTITFRAFSRVSRKP